MDERDFFIVAEIQSGNSVAVLTTTHNSWNAALSKFYQTMVSVAQSSVPEHTVVILDRIGNIRKKETIYHEVTE